MKDPEDAQRLIRLKRYESPGEEYFEAFRERFKDRQRAEMLRGSARGLLFERASTWFDELGTPRWLLPAGAAAAILVTGAYFSVSPLEDGRKAGSLAKSLEASLVTPDSGEAALDEVITLQLPRPENRIPGLGAGGLSGTEGIFPVGSAGLREL